VSEKTNHLQTIGANVRKLRHSFGYSQVYFAALIKFDRSYLGAIERGERNLPILKLIQIAQGIGVSVSELLKGI